MPFDLSTATPVKTGFDLSTAKPVDGGPAGDEPKPGFVGTLEDMARSIPGGLVHGFASIAGLPADIGGLVSKGMNAIGIPTDDPSKPLPAPSPGKYIMRGPEAGGTQATSANIIRDVSAPFGGDYQPKTIPGEYAHTIASFAPAAVMGGGSGGIGTTAARVLAPAVASETAGQFAKGTQYEGLARAGGALAGGMAEGLGEGIMNRPEVPPAPSTADLRQQADQIYKAADKSGVTINPDAYDGLVGDIKSAVREAGTHPKLHPKVAGVLESLEEVQGQQLSLGELERLRRIANGAARSIEPDERRVAGVIVGKIDDFMENLKPEDVASGDPAVAGTLSDARDIWSRMKKSEMVETAVERAKDRATWQNGNQAAALRGEFQSLSKNQKFMRGLSEAEKAAIRDVARVGPTTGTLSALGVLRPRGLIGWGELAGSIMDPAAAAPLMTAAAVGQGAQWGANALTSRSADMASALMRGGQAGAPLIPAASAANLPRQLLLSTLLSQGVR